MSEQLAGWWYCGDPVNSCDTPGTLELERRANGRWYDPEFDVDVTASYDPEMQCIVIEEETHSLWVFLPDPGECERVGLPIEYSGLPDDVQLH